MTSWVPPEGSWASSAARRRNMQAIRSRDTKPERLIRSLLHAQGLRYRVAAKPLPDLRRTADIVFGPAKVAVFIDGCYWHGCPEHYVPPKTNSGYWSGKVAGNMARDRDTDQRLREACFDRTPILGARAVQRLRSADRGRGRQAPCPQGRCGHGLIRTPRGPAPGQPPGPG